MPNDKQLVIREMAEADCAMISEAFSAQGWNKPLEQYRAYWQESRAGKRVVLLAEFAGQFAGYITIVWESYYPPFRLAGIPEIVDFNVLKRFQRLGIGTVLMQVAEQRIALRSPLAGLGVGLFADYGPAQVLYARCGYVPDGRGVYQEGHFPTYGERVTIDDDLVLHLTRQLSET